MTLTEIRLSDDYIETYEMQLPAEGVESEYKLLASYHIGELKSRRKLIIRTWLIQTPLDPNAPIETHDVEWECTLEVAYDKSLSKTKT
jgi:hypothetical protein